MTIVDRAPAPHAPACRPVSTRRASSWTSTSSRRMRGGWPTARRRGASRWPHIKTHKSVALARLQLDAGAAGITVGTLGEAEAMVDGGIDDVFVGYPLWADGVKASASDGCTSAARFRSGWTRRGGGGAARRRSRGVRSGPLRVLVELDSGARRSGVAGPADAVADARPAAGSRSSASSPTAATATARPAPGRRQQPTKWRSSAPPPTRCGPTASRSSGSAPARRRPASTPQPARSPRSGPGHTSSAIASSSSSARSRPTGSPPSSPRPSSRPPSPARSSSTPGRRR